MEIVLRRTLFESELMQVGHVMARPTSPHCGEIERQTSNVLVFPLAGVFAKHDGPRRHVIATANHAVFIAADSPYRISYPGAIGDQCLTLRFSIAALARVLPDGVQDGVNSPAFASHALLPPLVMLRRSLLWRRLVRSQCDPLEIEELSIDLLASGLHAASKERAGRSERGAHRSRPIELVKEAISLAPERRWTLGGLADLANVSPYHMAHIFRETVGASVYQYVLRARLAKALNLVLDADTDLTEIALETGFSSHSHFTARFRALFGLTPTEVRRGVSGGTASQLRKIVTAKARVAA